jgi:ATP synthase protein I
MKRRVVPADRQRLVGEVTRQSRRFERARQYRRTLLGHAVYLTTIGMLLALPIIGGAYLGLWLDHLFTGSPVNWTLTMILFGVACGSANVYLAIRNW